MNDHDAKTEHPALHAWRQLGISAHEPSRIVALQEKKKTAVYALHGVGWSGGSIVAKRSSLPKALVEKTIYEDLLPLVPLPGLAYYGFVQNEETGWLFVEQARGESYSQTRTDHRRLAARWLGRLHLAASSLDLSGRLPAKTSDTYLAQLAVSSARVRRGCTHPALDRSDRVRLTTWMAQLDHLQSNWDVVRHLYAEMPQTVTHGDFATKNMLVHSGGGELFVFDWGTAGWGAPCPDLPQNDPQENYWVGPDLGTYREVVSDAWPQLDAEQLQAGAGAGKIVRALSALQGDTKALETPWASTVMHKLPVYFAHLSAGMAAAGIPIGTTALRREGEA